MDPKPYKETLNLPSTKFAMKANLNAREPECQARWEEMGLYRQIREARAGHPRRVLHDGPPYANGEIHMGHLLNKVLKDIVVRYYTLRGFDSPYVPGWDCHGLPIEHKVVRDLGKKAAEMSFAEIRELCQKEALHWVDIQRQQFQRLGVIGDWENPYLTLDPRYEAGIMDVLADLVEKGYVFRQLKPIHWDIQDRTALAEAELEYQDHSSPSVYVLFPMESGVPAAWGEGPWHALIWTTTPWTLPANVAIAAHPDLEYVGVRFVDPESAENVQVILTADLVQKVLSLKQVENYKELGRCKGKDLEHARYQHIFAERTGPIVLAPYVTTEDGTGLVHTAPGHGADDYKTGQAYGLPTLSPVDASGRFLAEAGVPDEVVGQQVFAANPAIIELLKKIGALYFTQNIRHSYPHGWRSKKPVIFRATHQWFIGADHEALRERTLQAIDKVKWIPAWGRARIDGMVQNRPDWCISRQRAWGVPIPVISCEKTGYQHLTAESVRYFRDLFRKEGADTWFKKPVEELIPPDLDTEKYPVEHLRKGTDILDVWFESGSSHRSVIREESYDIGPYPSFMYLEGSDQHRGWFQSSILTAVGTTGEAPFETVLTHGFIVDKNGKKMSKSLGNVIHAVKATEQYGADVLRLYVASMDYAEDIRMSENGIKEMSEAYRKIRNTFRYLVGNLEDYARFDPSTVEFSTLQEIDRWALGQLNAVVRDTTAAFEKYEFYRAFQRVYQFCSGELSSFYLDVLKDRLYAEGPESPERRAAQFVLAQLHSVLTRLLAPLMPHTAEEVWALVPDSEHKTPSVHLAHWPEPDPSWDDLELEARWRRLLNIRSGSFAGSGSVLVDGTPTKFETKGGIFSELERLRKHKIIGSNQEAIVTLYPDDPSHAEILENDRSLLTTLCMVSEIVIEVLPKEAAFEKSKELGKEAGGMSMMWEGPQGPIFGVIARKSHYSKCERCWNLRPSVGKHSEHPTLCERCSKVVSALNRS